MSAWLHVLLGSGGVGKTTLAVAYALALAHAGRRVGLLGIDPSRRVEDALGLALSDLDGPVPMVGGLRAATVHPHQALIRWATESTSGDAARRLPHNPFFVALGDQLATAIDVLAAARVAEWRERDPGLTDLVVDTAPGLAAIDFIRSPRQVEAVVQGKLIRWLRAVARSGDGPLGSLWSGGRWAVAGLARLGGIRTLGHLAEFVTAMRSPLERMLVRVDETRRWIASPQSDLLLVTSPRDTGAAGARQIADALRREGLAPRAVVVNRTWPAELARELARVQVSGPSAPFLAFARACLRAQEEVEVAAVALGPTLVELPSAPALALAQRGALADLGGSLLHALSQPPPVLRRAS